MAISFLPSPIHAFTFLRDHYRNWPKEAGKRLLAASSGPFNQDDPNMEALDLLKPRDGVIRWDC